MTWQPSFGEKRLCCPAAYSGGRSEIKSLHLLLILSGCKYLRNYLKQEFDLRQAEIERKNKENKSYRTWGGVIVR
jgi:hypothetical protein